MPSITPFDLIKIQRDKVYNDLVGNVSDAVPDQLIDKKTIKLDSYFGEKDFTLKEFKKRWNSPVNEIWAFLIDHGSVEEMKFGKKLA